MRNIFPTVAMLVLLLACSHVPAHGSTLYVDDAVSVSGDGASWETAFKTIQEGINAAAINGDTVIVAEGIYVENIFFDGKNLVLRTTLPLDPYVVSNTVIDGSLVGSAVTFNGTENETCVLSGFTIVNGHAFEGGGICGGDWTVHTHAGICNNVIWGNIADSSGGGIAFCDGVIQNNVIGANTAGGFLSGIGGGLDGCSGTVQNNTVVWNSAGLIGGGLFECNGIIQNCIIWGNEAFIDSQISGSIATYSCIQGWDLGGDTNTSEDPLFLDPAGDVHLWEGSPCIDSGNPDSFGIPETDLDGNPRIVNGIVDMGAYEFQVPMADIDVSPLVCDFGEVEVGLSATLSLTISNVGDEILTLHGIGFQASSTLDFSILSVPSFPLDLPPVSAEPANGKLDLEIAFAPSADGNAEALLAIVSDDPDEPSISVSLSGIGVQADPSFEEQIEQILDFFDASIENGDLVGDGPGKSAKGRLNALGNMLEAVAHYIEAEDLDEACRQLRDAYRRTDGQSRPPDFVTGVAAAELASMILDLIGELGGSQ